MTDLLRSELRSEIETALNRVSAENSSNTPDFILAQFLISSLHAFDVAVQRRTEWYGHYTPSPMVSFDPIK
jgi:hypothetical protein